MRGKGRTKLLETAFTLLNPRRFDAINELQDLTLQPQRLAAGLAKQPVVVRQLLHRAEMLRWRRDVLGSALAAVAQHRAGVQFAPGAVAGRFSATATESIQSAGQKRFPSQECLQDGRELLLEFAKLPAEGTERVGHDVTRGEGANGFLCIIMTVNPQMSSPLGKKIRSGRKIADPVRNATGKKPALSCEARSRRQSPRNGRMGLLSSASPRTHPAASYEAAG
jgi:hypothetical protein